MSENNQNQNPKENKQNKGNKIFIDDEEIVSFTYKELKEIVIKVTAIVQTINNPVVSAIVPLGDEGMKLIIQTSEKLMAMSPPSQSYIRDVEIIADHLVNEIVNRGKG